MYEEYYGFTEKPFSLTPDPKYLFKSESHANAFDLLQYAVRRREGFVVFTGDIGTGKTTLCRALLEEIDRNTFSALVLNPFLTEEDLLKLILQDFGVVSREDVKRGRLANVTKQELIDTIYDFLLSLLPLHASALLIIDEAQNLPMPVLEQLRILSNLETDKEKLLQIVLVGQLNLQTLLKAPQMRQLDQRVSIRYQLKPLTSDEVAAYVAHRLKIAGGHASVTFQPKALDLVHRYSGGLPRLVNLLCDRALLAAFSARNNRVSAEMVAGAAESLEMKPRAPRFSWFGRRTSVAVTAAGATMALSMSGSPIAPSLNRSDNFSHSRVTREALPLPVLPSRPAMPVPALAPVAIPVDAGLLPERPFAVLTASFPVSDIERGGGSQARLDSVTAHLQALGYTPWVADVSLKGRGQWRRVLVGQYATLDEARRTAEQLHATPVFGDAQPLRY